MEDLELLKKYLRIDGSEDDVILTLLMDAAEEYLADAGVPVTEKASAKYKLAVMLHTAMNYENRNPAVKMQEFNKAFESIIWQLKS